MGFNSAFKGLNTELNPICHLLALLGAHHILHVSRIRVKHYAVNMCREMEVQLLTLTSAMDRNEWSRSGSVCHKL